MIKCAKLILTKVRVLYGECECKKKGKGISVPI